MKYISTHKFIKSHRENVNIKQCVKFRNIDFSRNLPENVQFFFWQAEQ